MGDEHFAGTSCRGPLARRAFYSALRPMSSETQPTLRRRSWSDLPWHPLLIAIFPVLSLAAHNRHEVEPQWVLVPALAALLATAAAWVALRLFVRDWTRAALPASIAVLMFFGYGHLASPLIDAGYLHSRDAVLPVLIGQAVVLLVACLALRRHAAPPLLTRFVNVLAVAVVLVPAVILLSHGAAPVKRLSSLPGFVATREARPDVYLIIPDAHARGDVLRDVYDYDAEGFFAELEMLGFAVARQSSANYSMTPLSVASMLNFDYLDPAPDLAWGELSPFTSMIRHSAMESLLVGHGYKTVAFPSAASYTEMRHFEQYHRGLGAALGFYRMVADLTPLAGLLEDHPAWNGLLSDRDRLLRTLDEIPEVASDPEPTFTFVHLSLPHPPFQFGENGEDVFAEYRGVDDDGIGSRSLEAQQRYPEAYRRQVTYTNRRLLEVVRQILQNSETPPVILIVSDHGPRLNFHWRDAQATDVREALGNLTAVYLPDGRAQELIYPTITPVNVMRIALNEALGLELGLLDDRSYLSTNDNEIHQLADVTRRLQWPQPADPFAGLDSQQLPASLPQPPQLAPEKWVAPVDLAPLLR